MGPIQRWRPAEYPVEDGGRGEDTWIIKSVWEHASIGLDETNIVKGKDKAEISSLLRLRAGSLGGSCFAERFVDGREFNLSLLGGGPDNPMVLPPAEIVFEDFDAKRPRIVDYQAKWDETSFAFQHTPRRFDFAPNDGQLLETLQRLAKKCWIDFGLRGYARVDFRVDPDGKPWILSRSMPIRACRRTQVLPQPWSRGGWHFPTRYAIYWKISRGKRLRL